jgi:uncharacterized protein with GYD domain
MPLFVLMTKLAPETLHDAGDRRAVGKSWLHKVSEKCEGVKFLSHFALLGPYDFMDLYEAPDIETAHRVSMLSRAEGALTAESWSAVPYDQYLKILADVQD